MVLRCSLLGHDYGEPEVERERDKRGSEVVLTVEEYERCDRCGTKNVISENTEVTSIAADDDADAVTVTEDVSADPSDDAGEAVEFEDERAPGDGERGDVADDEHAVAADAESDLPTDEDGEPITDDAEILDAPDEPVPDREHGEWPDSEDVGPPVGSEREPSAWPESETDAEPGGRDDVGRAGDAGVDGAGDRPPEPTTGDGPGAVADDGDRGEAVTDDAVLVDAEDVAAARKAGPESTDTGFESAGAAPTPGEQTVRDGVPTEFFCPRCSFVAPGDRGSLRPGDICPDCKKGYLGERER